MTAGEYHLPDGSIRAGVICFLAPETGDTHLVGLGSVVEIGSLEWEVVERIIARCNATGVEIGRAKSAMKLTIKSVWDFPEMQRRGLLPTDKEREATRVEIETIIATANEILR